MPRELDIGQYRHSVDILPRGTLGALDASGAPTVSNGAATATRRCSYVPLSAAEPVLAEQMKGVADAVLECSFVDATQDNVARVTTSFDNRTFDAEIKRVDQVDNRGRKTRIFIKEQRVGA